MFQGRPKDTRYYDDFKIDVIVLNGEWQELMVGNLEGKVAQAFELDTPCLLEIKIKYAYGDGVLGSEDIKRIKMGIISFDKQKAVNSIQIKGVKGEEVGYVIAL